jgi:alpha-glucosidase
MGETSMFFSCKKAVMILIPLMCLAVHGAAQAEHSLFSPNKEIEVRIRTGDRLQYDVQLKGTPLLQNSTLSIDIDHTTLGLQPKIKAAKERSYDSVIEPVVHRKFAKLRENYNELRLEMQGNYAVVFRAYDDGVAYRLETSLPQNEVKVYKEEANFNFPGDYVTYYPQEDSFFSHNERRYLPFKLSQIAPSSIASLPAIVEAANGVKVALAESDLEEYPGLWLRGTGGNGLAATFPPYPLQEKLEKDRDLKVVEAADYIAVTRGTRSYPWRVIGIAQRDGDLITSELVVASQTFASAGHFLDSPWKGRMGLVERHQHLRRGFQVRNQHPDLQVLYRLRGKVRHRVHNPR